MKVMLVGGVKDAKFEKFSGAIKKNCGVEEVVTANLFKVKPEEVVAEEKPDVVVMLNKQKFDFGDIPVIDGMGLVYPQMGEKKVYEEISKLK